MLIEAYRRRCLNWLGAIGAVIPLGLALGEVSIPPQDSSSSDTPAIRAVEQQQRALVEQLRVLMARHASPQEIAAWQTAHGPQINALDIQLKAFAPKKNLAPLLLTNRDDATAETKEFEQNRAKQAKAFSQGPTFSTNAPSPAYAALLQRQMVLAKIVAQQQRAVSEVPTVPALATFPDDSPQLKAYLQARQQLMIETTQLQAQYKNADDATRAAALQKWAQNNAARNAKISQMAIALTTQNNKTGSPP